MKTILSSVIPPVEREGRIVIAASALRSLGYGFLSVFLGVYFDLLEFTPWQAGLVFSAIMAGGTLSNIVASWKGDTIGRKRMLIGMAALMGVGGLLFPMTERTSFLIAISLIAMTTSTGGDRTAFLSLDMAILAQLGNAKHRTALFSWYNLAGRLTKSVGALLIAAPPALSALFDMGEVASFEVMFFGYAIVAFGGVLIYSRLGPEVEQRPAAPAAKDAPPMPRSARMIMIQLAALFSLDSLGGGFMVYSFMSYFFANRFDMGLETIAAIFFVGQLLNAVSIMLAAPLARRIGLIATMASTQSVSNSMMILMAITGNAPLAIAFYMIRELVNDMDIPTRQSYSMAIVPPEARTATASVTNMGRTLAQAISPAIAGIVAQSTALGVPIIIGSVIKLVYNAALYATFRGVSAPEERE